MQDDKALQSSLQMWDETFSQMEEGGDLTYGFLQLAKNDLESIMGTIACDHCRRQIDAEVELIRIVMRLSRLANEWAIAGSGTRKFRLAGLALPLLERITYLELKKVF